MHETNALVAAENSKCNTWPIVVGGVGGSGTRVVAQLLDKLNCYIGNDLNESLDNLEFVLLFNQVSMMDMPQCEFDQLLNIFIKSMLTKDPFTTEEKKIINNLVIEDRGQFSKEWLQDRKKELLNSDRNSKDKDLHQLWGWKVPTTHLILDKLIKSNISFKYIHVIRNGLDMAYSKNQNQLQYWGKNILGRGPVISANDSLKYWCKAHIRVLEMAEQLGEDFYMLNFDRLCLDPVREVKKLLEFLNIKDYNIMDLVSMIHVPRSLGRHDGCSRCDFDLEDLEFVKLMNFPANCCE